MTFAAFDCRGVEPIKWHPMDPLACKSTEGKSFEVDLSEDDWYDYDDENDLSVGITNLEHEFQVHRP